MNHTGRSAIAYVASVVLAPLVVTLGNLLACTLHSTDIFRAPGTFICASSPTVFWQGLDALVGIGLALGVAWLIFALLHVRPRWPLPILIAGLMFMWELRELRTIHAAGAVHSRDVPPFMTNAMSSHVMMQLLVTGVVCGCVALAAARERERKAR